MSITHSIVSALNLKDPHLHFSEDCVSSQSIRGVDFLVFSRSLSYDPPSSCPLCGSSNPGSAIIKHGTKSSLITLPSVSRRPAYLRLKKQRFLCKHCGHTFTASTSIISVLTSFALSKELMLQCLFSFLTRNPVRSLISFLIAECPLSSAIS